MVNRGEIWWVDFGEPVGSAPGFRRPALVVSSDRFNRSRISTVIVSAVTSNLRLGEAPGNVALPADSLPKPSVVNVSQLMTVDRALLDERVCALGPTVMAAVDDGLRLTLGLGSWSVSVRSGG
ncbi:MAG: type II toxin-antitoxin system PemK/MazF family toxin [Sporichthyaceae bacterium]